MDERLIPKKELCKLINISDSSLRKYISRGNLILAKKGFIDVNNDTNRSYLTNYAAKKGIDIDFLLYNKEPESVNEIPKKHESTKKGKRSDLTYTQLSVIKLNKDIDKIEVETHLKNLELKKKKAKVLPLDFIIEWSGNNVKGIFGETVNFGNSMIEQLCNEMDANIELKLKYKKLFKLGFSGIIKDGIKKQEPEALKHAKEYSLLTKW